MAQTLFYVPANSTTWTNQGTAGSTYNAKTSSRNLYRMQSNGYPSWGNFASADYVCIPAGSATDNQNTVSWEIGFYYAGHTGTNGFQKIWDKGVGAYSIYLDEQFDVLTINRMCSSGQIWFIPTTTKITPGHNYYIQISWASGSAPAGGSTPYPTIYIGVDGNAPVHQTSWDETGGALDGTGSWRSDSGSSGSSAEIGNYSSGGCLTCTTACPTWGYDWFNGTIYVFRQYNSIQDFSSGGTWNADKARWLAATPQANIFYLGNAPGSSSFPTTGTTITNKGSSGSSYNGVANTNRYATLGSYTQWVLSGSTDRIVLPSGSYVDNMTAMTFEIGLYYVTTASDAMLFSKATVNDLFYALIDSDGYIWIYRPCATGDPVQVQSIDPLTQGWHDIQITWGGTYPILYVDNAVVINAVQSVGSGAWDDDSGEAIYIGNEDGGGAYDTPLLNSHLASVRVYNYVITSSTRSANYTADSARWAGSNTPISSAETITLRLTETQTPESTGTTTYRSQNEAVHLVTTETSRASLPALNAETVTLVLTEYGGHDIRTPTGTSTETVTLITTETQAINAVSAEYIALTITEVTTPQTAFKPITDEIVYLEIVEAEWVCVL